MREFRLLKADEIECRVQSQNEKGVSLLLYKTARTDAKILDEKFGIFGWQNKYEVINGNMYCSIGVFNAPMDEWVWKSNCGTESNTEKEKGEASDALKRAGFTWGIGTELYSSPFIWIKAEDIEMDSRGKCKSRFNITEIGYDSNENINLLVVTASDGKGKDRPVFNFGKGTTKAKQIQKPEPKTEGGLTCENCGKIVLEAKRKDGSVIPIETIVAESRKRFNKCYCSSCLSKEIKNLKENKNA